MSIRSKDEDTIRAFKLARTRLRFINKYGEDAYARLMGMVERGATLKAMGDEFGGLSKQRMDQLLQIFLDMPYSEYRGSKKTEVK